MTCNAALKDMAPGDPSSSGAGSVIPTRHSILGDGGRCHGINLQQRQQQCTREAGPWIVHLASFVEPGKIFPPISD